MRTRALRIISNDQLQLILIYYRWHDDIHALELGAVKRWAENNELLMPPSALIYYPANQNKDRSLLMAIILVV